MAGPGASKEVGRVSVRVVPDTERFRSDVKRELEKLGDFEVPIKPDLKGFKEKIQAELKKLKDQVIKVRVEVDRSALDKPLKPKGDAGKVELPVDLDIEQGAKNRFLQRVRKITDGADFKVKIGVDTNEKSIRNRLKRLFTAIRSGVNRAGPAVDRFTDSFLTGLSNIGNTLRRAVIPWLLIISAITPLIAIAGAAIAVAYGAIATAVAAVPAGLFLIATAAGAVMLGLDGIKKAASVLKPEFDALKKSVSDTFEKGLTPIFEFVKKSDLFKVLTTGMNQMADALIQVAQGFAEVLTNEGNLARLGTIFSLSANAVQEIGFHLARIFQTMLKVASLPGVFDALIAGAREFQLAFEKAVTDTIGDGSLQRAFKGLEGTLGALSRGFVYLVTNGIRLFAGAAPGFNQFFDSLNGFFNRFDWERLGRATGNVFKGLAETLDGLSDQDIEDITVAFEKMGDLFRDPAFQQNLRDIIRAFDDLIDIMRTVSAVVIPIAGAVARVLSFPGVAEAIGVGLVAAVTLFFAGLLARILLWIRRIDTAIKGFKLGQKLANMFKAIGKIPVIGPIFSRIALGIGSLAKALGKNLVTKLGSLARVLGRFLLFTPVGRILLAAAAAIDILVGALKGYTEEQEKAFAQGNFFEDLKIFWDEFKNEPFQAIGKEIWASLKPPPETMQSFTDAGTRFDEMIQKWRDGKAPVQEWFNTVKTSFNEDFIQVFAELPGKIGTALSGLAETARTKFDEFKQRVIEKCQEIDTSVTTFFSELPGKVTSKFQELKDQAVAKLSELVENARQKASEIQTSIENGLSTLGDIAQRKFDEFKTSAQQKLDEAIQAAKDAPGKIRDALEGLSLYQSGLNLVQTFYDGLKSKFDSAIALAREKLAVLRGLFPSSPAKWGPFSGTSYHKLMNGQLMVDFGKGLARGGEYAIATVESAMGRIQSAMDVDPVAVGPGSLAASVTSTQKMDYGDPVSAAEKIADALMGMEFKMDDRGIAKLANKGNLKNGRR